MLTAIATQFATDVIAVRATATDLAATTAMSHADVADVLGTRPALLFPRVRLTTALDTGQPLDDVDDPAAGAIEAFA